MRQFIINKPIVLNFLTHNDSYDSIIDPKENTLLIAENNTIFYYRNGVKKETNNTTGILNDYIRDGYLSEVPIEHPKVIFLHPNDFCMLMEELNKPPEEPNEALKKAAERYKEITNQPNR